MAGFLFSMLSWLLWAAILAVPAFGQATFVKGEKWQIILTGTPDVSKMPLPPTDALVWDIDLFDNDAATVKALQAAGKTVICYFSAGTVEDWRDDAKQFPAADTGKVLPEWPNEKWIRISSTKVRDIIAARIKLASSKGCDAIDPDNVDGYQNDNGLNLKSSDSVDYIKWMQTEAAKYNMKIGLKNALDIVDTVTPNVDFAVNEQCAQLSECEKYNQFLATNKPVFHIEYPNPLNTSAARTNLCTGPGTTGMSTILKTLALDGQTVYCDGSSVDTPTKGGTRPTTSRTPTPPKTSSPPRPTSTPRPPPVTTQRPTSTPARTSSAARPTSTSGGGGGGGCRSKHWDQCGGQNWNGCTVCESPYTCKGVSPPYYYQCL